METVIDFSYLGNRIISGGGCEAAVTSRTRLGCVKFRDCQHLLCCKISSQNQRNYLEKLCEINNALWKRDVVPRPEWDRYFAKKQSYGEKCNEKIVDKKSIKDLMMLISNNADVGLEWNNRSAGKS